MHRSDRVIPFLSGLGVATLLAAGVALAVPGSEQPPTEVVIEPAATGAEQVVEEPIDDQADEPEPVVIPTSTPLHVEVPLLVLEKRAVDEDPEPEPVEVEEPAAPARKVAEPEPEKKAEDQPDGEKKKHDGHEEHDGNKKYDGKEYDGKEHDGHHDAWWPLVHGGHVTACSVEGEAVSVDWDVKLKGGSDWDLASHGATEVKQLDRGVLLRYTGSPGEIWPEHAKAKVSTSITVAGPDGAQKTFTVDAYAYLDHCTS